MPPYRFFLTLCLLALIGCQSPDMDHRATLSTAFSMDESHMDSNWWFEGSGRYWIEADNVHLQEANDGVGVVLWSKQELPSDFEISFDVSLSNERGIFVLFFAASGVDGSDLFETKVGRTGDYEEYIRGNINAYSASLHRYFPDGEHNPGANLRRNAGFNLLNTAMPDPMMESGKIYRVLVRKVAEVIRIEVDGELVHDYTDPEPLGGGRVGFRLRGDSSCVMTVGALEVVRLD